MDIASSLPRIRHLLLGLNISALLLGVFSVQAETIQPGQRLTFVLVENKPDADAVRQQYFAGAFPLAQAAGMREIITFNPSVIMGSGKPNGSGFYLWPDPKAADAARNNPDYVKNYRPLRPQAWNDMRSVDLDIAEALEINFDKDKLHTLALLWFKDAKKYQTYYQSTQAVRDRLGIKTLIKLPAVRYEKLAEGEVAPPDLVVVLQWNRVEDIAAYSQSPEFVAVQSSFMESVTQFEWYQLDFWN